MIQIRLWVRNFIHSQSLGTPLFLPVYYRGWEGDVNMGGVTKKDIFRQKCFRDLVTIVCLCLRQTVQVKYGKMKKPRIKRSDISETEVRK
jgi:hypothetical protein